MAASAFLGDALLAHLTWAALDPARHAGPVPFLLTTQRLGRI
jgi:hypothetical protein